MGSSCCVMGRTIVSSAHFDSVQAQEKEGVVYERRAQCPIKMVDQAIISSDRYGNRCINEYTELKSLGSGRFAHVFMCVNTRTDELYAMKECSRKLLTRNGEIVSEVQVLKAVQHPNVVKLFEVIDCPRQHCIYLVFEYVSGGAVMHIGENGLADRPALPEKLCCAYMSQLTEGLAYLHSRQIVHRDIKPDNILVTDDKSIVKLADFGVSQLFGTESAADIVRTSVGTPMYFAPEICNGQYFCVKPVDIWALGITLFALLTGRLPFAGSRGTQVYQDIQTKPIVMPDNISSDLKDLLSRMMERDVLRRITLPEVRDHPWISGNQGPLPQPQIDYESPVMAMNNNYQGKEGPLGVLVVEDNQLSRVVAKSTITAILKPPHSNRIDVLTDGLPAVEAYQKWPYRLVLMDVHLIDMDGLTATSQIRAYETQFGLPRSYIMGLTADGHGDLAQQCIRAGMDAVLRKPVRPSELRRAFLICGLGIHRTQSTDVSRLVAPVMGVSHVVNTQYSDFLRQTGEIGDVPVPGVVSDV